MTYQLDNKSLGVVVSERNEEQTDQITIAIPEGQTEDVEVLPTTGAVRIISVTGTFKGVIGSLQSFVAQLHTWVQSFGKTATAPITYSSDLLGSISVKVQGGSWFWDAGNPNSVNYELRLIQAKNP